MKKIAILMFLLFVLTAGCVENEGVENSPSPTITPTPSSETSQATDKSSDNIDEQADEVAENESNEIEKKLTEELKTYLYENFGGAGNPEFATSWYKSIEDVEVSVDEGELEVTIYTSLYPDDEGKEFAARYFPAIWGWANDASDPKKVVATIVKGQNNRILSWQRNPLY